MTSWRAYDADGRTYYHNEITKETTWDAPAVFKMADELSDDGGEENEEGRDEEEADDGGEENEEGRDEEEAEEEDEAPRWRRAFDEDKQMSYYYHSSTKEVTWARPEGFVDDEDVDEGFGGDVPEPEADQSMDYADYNERGDAAPEDGEVADEAGESMEGIGSSEAGVGAPPLAVSSMIEPTASGPPAPVASAIDPLALATAKLDEPDAIMEIDVADTINTAIQHGGNPAEMIPKLFGGYQVNFLSSCNCLNRHQHLYRWLEAEFIQARPIARFCSWFSCRTS